MPPSTNNLSAASPPVLPFTVAGPATPPVTSYLNDDDLASIYSGVTISQGFSRDGTTNSLYNPRSTTMRDDVRSFISFESNFTSPTYVEAPTGHGRGDPRFRESLATLTSPHRHAAAPQPATGVVLHPDVGREFVFYVGSQSQPWATLRILDAKARGRHPHYYGSDRITGNIELSLSTPQTIKSMKLVLKGAIVANGPLKILDQAYPIWDRKDGDPRKPGVKLNGQLEGELVFPFSIPFPTHVKLSTLSALNVATEDGPSNTDESSSNSSEHQISPSSSSSSASTSASLPQRRSRWGFSAFSNKSKSQKAEAALRHSGVDDIGNETELAEQLPQSFLERDVFANIQYDLTLVVTHGKFSSDSRVGTTITYTPRSKPPPMLLTRQLVYHGGGLLPGPGNDPKGWHTLGPCPIRGIFLDERDIEVNYTLYLAKPLSYARGTVIPCYITIACDDEMVLNLLSNPLAPRVALRRSTSTSGMHTDDEILNIVRPYMADSAAARGHAGTRLRPPTTAFERVSTHRRKLQALSELRNLGIDRGDPAGIPEGSREKGLEAVWWAIEDPTDDLERQPKLRALQGEIHLPKDLQPSCPFPLFTISYLVELLAPTLGAFVPLVHAPEPPASNRGKAPMAKAEWVPYDGSAYASEAVEITTDVREDEPYPTAFTRRLDN